MTTPVYVASVHVPGYLPEVEPRLFVAVDEAWAYLASERRRDEDQDDSTDEYSDIVTALDYIASGVHEHGAWAEDWPTGRDGSGSVIAPTPGSDSPYDLGLVYSVSVRLGRAPQ